MILITVKNKDQSQPSPTASKFERVVSPQWTGRWANADTKFEIVVPGNLEIRVRSLTSEVIVVSCSKNADSVWMTCPLEVSCPNVVPLEFEIIRKEAPLVRFVEETDDGGRIVRGDAVEANRDEE